MKTTLISTGYDRHSKQTHLLRAWSNSGSLLETVVIKEHSGIGKAIYSVGNKKSFDDELIMDHAVDILMSSDNIDPMVKIDYGIKMNYRYAKQKLDDSLNSATLRLNKASSDVERRHYDFDRLFLDRYPKTDDDFSWMTSDFSWYSPKKSLFKTIIDSIKGYFNRNKGLIWHAKNSGYTYLVGSDMSKKMDSMISDLSLLKPRVYNDFVTRYPNLTKDTYIRR